MYQSCRSRFSFCTSATRTKQVAASLRVETLEDAVPTIAVVKPKPLPKIQSITLPGNIVDWYETPICARISGYVRMSYKDYGGLVKKGDILAEISAPDLDAAYRQPR